MDPLVLRGVEARVLRDGVELALGGPQQLDDTQLHELREAVRAWLEAAEEGDPRPVIFVPFESPGAEPS
jgi:hypothetical protein